MKRMFGRTAMWIWATLAAATVVFAAGQEAPLPDGEGKTILQAGCAGCHGLDRVTPLHLDKDSWQGIVSSMISNGAPVSEKDVPVLVDYLVKNFGPPGAKPAGQAAAGGDAEAKKILENACTTCHDLDLVSGQHLSKEDWQGVVSSMVAKGASLSEKDGPILVEYLAKTYGKK